MGFDPDSYYVTHADKICPGWNSLILPLVERCRQEDVEILQIKEKLGGLRFYVGFGQDSLHKAIAEAEKKSYEICEVCGKEGKLRKYNSWLSTRCEEHNELQRRNEEGVPNW
jgi:hypothetical protein